jgi:hypothetical protein
MLTRWLFKGNKPNLWAIYSSYKADVFSLMVTNSIAIVGTSDITILLNELT